jgi:hypothetical protein
VNLYQRNHFNQGTFIFVLGLLTIFTLLGACAETSNPPKKTKKKPYRGYFELSIEGKNLLKAELRFKKAPKGQDVLPASQKDSMPCEVTIFKGKKNYIDTQITYLGKNDLYRKISHLLVTVPASRPQNAWYQYKNMSFLPEEAKEGDFIDTVLLKTPLFTAFKKNETFLDLTKSNTYLRPRFTLNSPETKSALEQLKKCLKSTLIYQFEKEEVELVPKEFAPWLILDSLQRVKMNQKEVSNYVRELASKFDKRENSITFTASTGETKTLNRSELGVRIDIFSEAKAILRDVLKGEKTKRDPVYAMKGIPPGAFDSNKSYVEINLGLQKLWYYKSGRLVVESDIVTGNVRAGNQTPAGAYFVNYKAKNATLKGPGYSAFVNYWMPFNKGIGLHDATWRRSFGGEIFKTDGSHGCINLPKSVAQTIFQSLDQGTIVLCY